MTAVVGLSIVVALVGCGHSNSSADPGPADAADASGCGPGFELTSGVCTPHFDECTEPATIPKPGGGCAQVGVPPDQCGAGFVADGNGGCDAILPKDACPSGQMAVPGETTCREVAPCGSGTWGDIPVDASTVYVDRGYSGGANDGSVARPFVTIQAAIDKAKTGSLVAVGARTARETYVEDIVVSKGVRLWGRCPALVEVQGLAAATSTPTVTVTGPGELHRLAISGPWIGIHLHAVDVTMQQLWIHDVGARGVYFVPGSRVTVQDSLIERSTIAGIAIFGSELALESSVIRDTQAGGSPSSGAGLDVDESSATKDGSKATVRGSLFERNAQLGVGVYGSELTFEASVIRDTRPLAGGTGGRGLDVGAGPVTRTGATATVRASLIEGNSDDGVGVFGSELTLEASVIRDTHPTADGTGGRGLDVDVSEKTLVGSKANVQGSLIDGNAEVGISIIGSELTMDASVIRDTRSRKDGIGGDGLDVQVSLAIKIASKAAVQGSLIERNGEAGVLVAGSDVTVEASVVRGTRASEASGRFGDGLSVFTWPDTDDYSPASLTIGDCLVRDNVRAGISTFGARIDVTSSAVRCNLFDIDYEKTLLPSGKEIGSVDDLNVAPSNACGCETAARCKALSNDLEALTPPVRP